MIKRAQILAWVLAFLAYPFAGRAKEASIAAQAYMIVKTVEKYHYAPKPVNDSFSEKVYTSFLHMLDPYATLFTEETMGKLDCFRFSLDDQIKQRKTVFLDSATALYLRQLRCADSLVRKLKIEEINLGVADTLWIGNGAVYGKQCNVHKKWEQWIKYMILWSYHSNKDSTDSIALQSQKETRTYFNDAIKRETCRIKLKTNPAGGIKECTGSIYLKAIASAFDPHTEYMSFTDKKQFESDLSKESGSFGIRVSFNIIGEIEINEVLPGGPAWNSNKINEGDVVLGIKKSDGTAIDLRCATLSDVYGLLSSIGNKQTDFAIRKKSGKIMTVPLKKEILDVEENTIRSYVLKGKSSVGYIYLPSFYADFSYNDYFSKGCANDLAKELIILKNAAIDGLILDVRSNSGGSMQEAIRMAGVFIDNGALCITHSRGKDPVVIKDNARGTIFNGPLIVLANSSSASAAELLAGVLQDYNRAVIVGSKTFGKSTIQNILPVNAGDFDSLSQYKGDPPGFLKLTTGSFYRVTGVSHQKVGIVPDVELPDLPEHAQDREASYDNALEFKNINKKTYYYPVDPLPVSALKSLCDTREKGNAGFKYIKKTGALIPRTNSRYPVPLAFQSFARFIDRFEEMDDSVTEKNCTFTTTLPVYAESKSSMTGPEKADDENIMRAIREDIYINEAWNVMNDLIRISIKKENK
jgi:carboxyl-terminal processing protease